MRTDSKENTKCSQRQYPRRGPVRLRAIWGVPIHNMEASLSYGPSRSHHKRRNPNSRVALSVNAGICKREDVSVGTDGTQFTLEICRAALAGQPGRLSPHNPGGRCLHTSVCPEHVWRLGRHDRRLDGGRYIRFAGLRASGRAAMSDRGRLWFFHTPAD